MKKLLYITANPKAVSDSHSLTVGESFLNEYKLKNPNDEIEVIDLFKAAVPLIDYDVMNAWNKLQSGTAFSDLTKEESTKVMAMNKNLEQFMNADKYVFVTPLWNFGVPPMVKAYVDNIVISGKTFSYNETGPVGLLKDKKALHIQASGSVFSSGMMQSYEHGNSYMDVVLKFIGVSDKQELLVEGMAMTNDGGLEIRSNNKVKAQEIAQSF